MHLLKTIVSSGIFFPTHTEIPKQSTRFSDQPGIHSYREFLAPLQPRRPLPWSPKATQKSACFGYSFMSSIDSGTIGTPRDLKNSSFAHEISMLRRSPGGLPGALYKTSKSISRYSKTSLLCQEFSKIFQDKPPRASLLERKPRSLQERIPRLARAGLEGWAAVPRRRRLG